MLCCFDGWWRVVCYLDDLNHMVFRRFAFQWICDVHDRHILGDWDDGDVEPPTELPPGEVQLDGGAGGGVEVEELNLEEGAALFDGACCRNLGVPGLEFLRRYDDGTAGEYWDDCDIASKLMLLPFVRDV